MLIDLVYQAGIANLFTTDQRGRRRLFQGTFCTAENMCRGAMLAGATVEVYSCNRAGDIIDAPWTRGLADCPFRDATRPPATARFANLSA